MGAARLAGLSGWHWLTGLALSVSVHGAVLVSVRPDTIGAQPRPSGKPVSVAGTLAGVLGNATVAGEARTVVATPVDTAKPAEPVRADTLPLIAPEPAQSSRTERSAPKPPDEVAAKRVPVTSGPVPAAPARPTTTTTTVANAAPLPAPKPLPKKQPSEPAPKPSTNREIAAPKPPARPAPTKRADSPKRRKKIPRKTARRSGGRVGTRQQGAGGRQRGGRGGVRSASAGAMFRYGARVRARIFANRRGGGGPRGRAIISFGVSSSGRLRYARVSRSSGNSTVDRAALQTVRRASPFPRPPKAASQAQLRFTLPFTFE